MHKVAEQLSTDIAVRAAQKLAGLNSGMEKDAGIAGALAGGLGGGIGGAVNGALNGTILGALKTLIYDQLIKGNDASWDLYAPNLKWGAGIGAGLGGTLGAAGGALGGHMMEAGLGPNGFAGDFKSSLADNLNEAFRDFQRQSNF